MKTTIAQFSFIVSFFLFSSVAFSQGINFEHDSTLAAIKAKARAANKPIFIDCYVTYCGPCKWMERNIFTNDTVGQFFNQNFVSVKMNMDFGDAKTQAVKYNVYSYPTYLFLDTAGKELQRFGGAMNASHFLENAQKYSDHQNSFLVLRERYKNGERDPDFMRKYLVTAKNAGDTGFAKMSETYFATLPDQEWVNRENFEILEKTLRSTHQAGFEKLLKHYKAFGEVAGKERVNAKINQVFDAAFNEVCFVNRQKQMSEVDEARYAAMVNNIKALDYDGKEDIMAMLNIKYHYTRQDKPAYLSAAKAYVAKYFWNDAWKLNSHAENFYRFADNKEDLLLALDWSKRALELYEEYYFHDTYAALCQKLNMKQEALIHAQKACSVAEEEGVKLKELEDRLEEIKKM